MIFEITPSDARPIYVQIMDEVRRARVLGTLRSGDALPSVRQLAAELGVNPNTVKQAYHELEREGVVEMRRGQGTYMADGALDAADRKRLLRDVAQRALLDAQRHGATPVELVEAIRKVAGSNHTEGV
jgi:GntR family transcriptional regulator